MPEYMDLVDENDEVIGRDTRDNIHKNGSWHRGVHVFLFNSKNEMLVQIRSSKMDIFPKLLDCAASGHLNFKESYEKCVKRELKEELGINRVKIKKLFKFKLTHTPHDNMISELWLCIHDGPFNFNKKEIEDVKFYSVKKLVKMLERNEKKITVWFGELLKYYFRMKSDIIIISE